jgi:hypothetical protein
LTYVVLKEIFYSQLIFFVILFYRIFFEKSGILVLYFYELIDLFIEARFDEIEGNYHLAKESYTKILESGCSYDFCKVVKVKHLEELEA